MAIFQLYRTTACDSCDSCDSSMTRSTKPTLADVTARLTTVKLMIRGTADAMPSLAKEMRREACESIDDIIQDLGAIGR